MKKILVTNDDGIHAEGIHALANALRELPNVMVKVIAPDRERSTVSHSLTLHRPLRVEERDNENYAVNGTPSDSVFLGTSAFFNEKPDFVFSGINRGGNLGDDVHYSGTVSAAVEGAIVGIPSVAISQLGKAKFDYTVAAQFAKKAFELITNDPLPPHIVLNINVPEGAKSLDFEVTKTGKRDYGGPFEKRFDPRGRPYYWIGGDAYRFEDIEGSDCNAIVAGKISVTPLEINLTSQTYVEKIKHWK
jgi:5'-nucleotidase